MPECTFCQETDTVRFCAAEHFVGFDPVGHSMIPACMECFWEFQMGIDH